MIKIQHNQSLDPKKYKIRILIAATNDCNNKEALTETLEELVNNYNEDILFISRNKTELERLTVKWCEHNSYPCLIVENTDDDVTDIKKSIVYASEMTIYNKKNEYPFNLYMTLAKRAKIDISTIALGD